MRPRRIALSSTGPLSGKTTLANYLAMHHNFVHAKHNETLYVEYLLRYNERHEGQQLTIRDMLLQKEAHRQALQETGIQCGFDQPERSLYWVLKTLNSATRHWEFSPVVFDNIRGEAQAGHLRDLGFVIVQITIPESVRLHRSGSEERYLKLRENMGAHPDIEYGIVRPDIILPGDQPVARLAEALVGPIELAS